MVDIIDFQDDGLPRPTRPDAVLGPRGPHAPRSGHWRPMSPRLVGRHHRPSPESGASEKPKIKANRADNRGRIGQLDTQIDCCRQRLPVTRAQDFAGKPDVSGPKIRLSPHPDFATEHSL